jgi:hypothetical protein
MDPIELVRLHGSVSAAARELGVPRATLSDQYRKALEAAGIDDVRTAYQATTRPDFKRSFTPPPEVDPNLPIEDILEQASKRFRQLKNYEDAVSNWPIIKIHDNLPIGVLWFGDPHLGDNGMDIDLMRAHTKLCADTEGLYGANIGDTTNNWLTVGKLAKKWAEQDTSISTEQRLAKWLMTEAGVEWLVWIIGNHDGWNHGERLLRAINITGIFMKNWEAKFIVEFPNGCRVKIHAAHNFKGFSDWNPMHGPLKASIKSSDADLYVAGHIHTPGSMQINLQGTGRFPLLLRVASYKRFDSYALTGGFEDHDVGSAVLTIFNPNAKTRSGKVQHFFDVELGARVLTMMRNGAEIEPASSNQVRPRQKSARVVASRRTVGDRLGATGRKGKVRRG